MKLFDISFFFIGASFVYLGFQNYYLITKATEEVVIKKHIMFLLII